MMKTSQRNKQFCAQKLARYMLLARKGCKMGEFRYLRSGEQWFGDGPAAAKKIKLWLLE